MQWVGRIGSRLKLRDLHILLTVVQRGSMAKAAADLAISQPAVSKAIADMEHTSGLRLLDRGRSGIEPTAYGRALVTRGQVIFDELKLGMEELTFLADPTVGELHIASTESVAAGLLPALLERFSREQPRIRVNVAQAVMNTAHYRELRERSIDLLIGRIPDPFSESELEAKIVCHDQMVVVDGSLATCLDANHRRCPPESVRRNSPVNVVAPSMRNRTWFATSSGHTPRRKGKRVSASCSRAS
jgi:DNA-binding transcriptional LysR family regulator